MVEQQTFNLIVESSNLSGSSIYFSRFFNLQKKESQVNLMKTNRFLISYHCDNGFGATQVSVDGKVEALTFIQIGNLLDKYVKDLSGSIIPIAVSPLRPVSDHRDGL